MAQLRDKTKTNPLISRNIMSNFISTTVSGKSLVRITYSCDVYPLHPHFYIEGIQGYTDPYFFIQNIDCGNSLERVSKISALRKNKKISFFLSFFLSFFFFFFFFFFSPTENFQFLQFRKNLYITWAFFVMCRHDFKRHMGCHNKEQVSGAICTEITISSGKHVREINTPLYPTFIEPVVCSGTHNIDNSRVNKRIASWCANKSGRSCKNWFFSVSHFLETINLPQYSDINTPIGSSMFVNNIGNKVFTGFVESTVK